MFKFILAFLVFGIGLFYSNRIVASIDVEDTNYSSIVVLRIKALDSKNNNTPINDYLGTAIFIGENTLLTALHCLPTYMPPYITINNININFIKIIKNSYSDLAILILDEPNNEVIKNKFNKVIKLNFNKLEPNQDLFYIGTGGEHNLAYKLKRKSYSNYVKDLAVSNINDKIEFAFVSTSSNKIKKTIEAGGSGGPLLNSNSELIGVNIISYSCKDILKTGPITTDDLLFSTALNDSFLLKYCEDKTNNNNYYNISSLVSGSISFFNFAIKNGASIFGEVPTEPETVKNTFEVININ